MLVGVAVALAGLYAVLWARDRAKQAVTKAYYMGVAHVAMDIKKILGRCSAETQAEFMLYMDELAERAGVSQVEPDDVQ
jgi:hypothetical protein